MKKLAALAGLALIMAGNALAFDQDRAMMLLTAQVAFGPRVPNSPEAAACRDFLHRELSFWCDTAWVQPFSYTSTDQGQTLKLYNIVGQFNPKAADRVMLCGHWDSRPFCDRDPDPNNQMKPLPAANDGAGQIAILLEIARQLHVKPVSFGVDFVFFDGEDFGRESVIDDYLLGSKHFASTQPIPKPRYGILLDLVAEKDLKIQYELNSYMNARHVVEKVFAAAERVKAMSFVREPGQAVMDDHIPFLEKGIPVIDLIDFDYKYWHTIEDTPDECSPYSMGEVGRTILDVLHSEKF
ncbi:MAG: M28 family peptidase [bacterium]|nr:M28 family peptidase [bacterium]